MDSNLILFYKGPKNLLPSALDLDSIYYTTDAHELYIQGRKFIDKEGVLDLFVYIDKSDYKQYININPENAYYEKILFIRDGSGIIYKGQLYANSSFWLKIVDNEPAEDEREENTVYLIRE